MYELGYHNNHQILDEWCKEYKANGSLYEALISLGGFYDDSNDRHSK